MMRTAARLLSPTLQREVRHLDAGWLLARGWASAAKVYPPPNGDGAPYRFKDKYDNVRAE